MRSDRGIFSGHVGVRGALAANRACRDDEVPYPDAGLGTPTGSDPQKGVHPQLAQLLYRDGHGRAADAAGAGRDPGAVDPTGEGAELTRPRLLLCVLEVPGDQCGAKRVARDENIMTDL